MPVLFGYIIINVEAWNNFIKLIKIHCEKIFSRKKEDDIFTLKQQMFNYEKLKSKVPSS